MTDGSSLRQTWYQSLDNAETHFRKLLITPSGEWKHVSYSSDTVARKGKGRASLTAVPELADIIVHRHEDVYRMVLEVPSGEDPVTLEPWVSVLSTPELRQEWDPAVIDAHVVEVIDHSSRICKTNFTLGWPANPRDSVTISRTISDSTTCIDISTSLPRSPDEPVYLRPSPPYVRSTVALLAWCIQYIQPPLTPSTPDQSRRKSFSSNGGRIRITCFCQHDLRSVWNFGSTNTIQQLATMVLGLFKTVLKRGTRIPKLIGYGGGVSVDKVRFQNDRQALHIDYSIIPDDGEVPQDYAELQEYKRLTRAIECVLPSTEGWDVQVSTHASSEELESLPWTINATRTSSYPLTAISPPQDQILLRLSHSDLVDEHSTLRVHIVIEISGPSSGLRVNGVPHNVEDSEERDPIVLHPSKVIPQISTASVYTTGSASLQTAATSAASSTSNATVVNHTERSSAAAKSILSRVKRNYIYFSSLLQEPEAKWRRNSEARGVTITQLDSIDPTLVVYRAEATFVGVGLWDLYGAVVSAGARNVWDKQHEDAVLLEDVNELSELWHFKTKPAWPAVGRDSVVLKTVYKSPTTIHVFQFSADDQHLFPNIPPVEPNIIRTQVDIRGWAIEALSPTTTLLTLLEQSDPKGWTNKTSIPTIMINSVAGIGEFSIKYGGPPLVTRLTGAKAIDYRYDHDRLNFKVEYEPSSSRRLNRVPASADTNDTSPVIECEIRCDVDTWAPSLDIVVDPPPQSISCLRRHRLSLEGGGLWLTIAHDSVFMDDERVLVLIRRGPGKERGLVMLNGAKVNVDVEDMPDQDIKALQKQKRVKPARIPLDQPPVVGVIRKRRDEWNGDEQNSENKMPPTALGSTPRFSSPLSRLFAFTVDQATLSTQQAVRAITPTTVEDIIPSASKPPMQYAMEALAWAQDIHSKPSSDPWTPVSDKGLNIQRRVFPEISPTIPVHKGEKIIEGVSAEELASIVTEYGCRKQWDDRFDSAHILESFGGECRTSFMITKASFPFRDRGFYLSTVMARSQVTTPSTGRRIGDVAEQTNGARNAIFCVAASFSPDSVTGFSVEKYNTYGLPIGRVFVDAWILETLDPYTKENYAIPSSRCTRLIAMDCAGSMPTAVNTMINAAFPRAILAIESYFRSISPLPITRLPSPLIIISEKKEDEPSGEVCWKLRLRDENRLLVYTKYIPESSSYKTVVLIRPMLLNSQSPNPNPRPSRLVPSSSSTIELRVPSTDSHSSPSTDNRPATASTSSATPTLPSSTAIEQNSATPPRGRSSSAFTAKGEVRYNADFLATELVVDTRLYPDGYEIVSRSNIKSKETLIKLNTLPEENVLPFVPSIYAMPSSPMHSSGMNSANPTRHLVRLTLPTAQYQIPTVLDPLTGEMQLAPPRPQWFTELEEGGAIIEVEVKPAVQKGLTDGFVNVNGLEIVVVSEKESLTSLGREELLDDKVAKMAVLYRVADETEVLPPELKYPIGIADGLMDPVVTSRPLPDDTKTSQETEGNSKLSEASEETTGVPSKLESSPTVPPRTASGSLLGFFQNYSRFSPISPSTPPPAVPGALLDLETPPSRQVPVKISVYTTVVIAIMAFLIGSLLRSLLSPADFVYVVTDLADAEEARQMQGWREMKRLFELKRIIGGWDFQLAVVRRP